MENYKLFFSVLIDEINNAFNSLQSVNKLIDNLSSKYPVSRSKAIQ